MAYLGLGFSRPRMCDSCRLDVELGLVHLERSTKEELGAPAGHLQVRRKILYEDIDIDGRCNSVTPVCAGSVSQSDLPNSLNSNYEAVLYRGWGRPGPCIRQQKLHDIRVHQHLTLPLCVCVCVSLSLSVRVFVFVFVCVRVCVCESVVAEHSSRLEYCRVHGSYHQLGKHNATVSAIARVAEVTSLGPRSQVYYEQLSITEPAQIPGRF